MKITVQYRLQFRISDNEWATFTTKYRNARTVRAARDDIDKRSKAEHRAVKITTEIL